MPKHKDPTKTEINLTVSATILSINLHQLLCEYESLAAKNDHVVNPTMQNAIAHSILQFSSSIAKKPNLSAISQDIVKQLIQFKQQQHEQLDA